MIPGSLALLTTHIHRRRQARAIGIWSAAGALMTIFGPVLGGILSEMGHWRAVFLINLPITLLCLTIVFYRVAPDGKPRLKELDLVGAFLISISLGGAAFGLLESADRGLSSPIVFTSLLLSVFCLAAFLYNEWILPKPLLSLSLFRSKDFSGSNATTFFLYAAVIGNLTFFPLVLAQVQGYSQFALGLALFPFAALLTIFSLLSERLLNRFGARNLITVGALLTALGFPLLALPPVYSLENTYWKTYFPGIFLLGVGMGLLIVPLTSTVMSSVKQAYKGAASGINNTLTRIASVFAIALFGAVSLTTFSSNLKEHLKITTLTNEEKTLILETSHHLGATRTPATLSQSKRIDVQYQIKTSFLDSYRMICWISFLLALFSAWIAYQTIKGPHRGATGGIRK